MTPRLHNPLASRAYLERLPSHARPNLFGCD